MKIHLLSVALLPCALLSGCATYHVPGGRADLTAITNPSIQDSFAAAPAAQLPAGVAFVRVQAPSYRNGYIDTHGGVWGQGRFSVVTVREVEDETDLARLAGLPQMGGLIGLSTMLLPQKLDTDLALRQAAARLKADMIVLYTFETKFHDTDKAVALSVVTLGLSPTRKIAVHVNASALVMDTRTGFIYCAIETNEKRELYSNAWESGQSADRARQDAERAAFKKLVGEFETAWPAITQRTAQGA
jgi:hypothetical protein